jgi:hypothetical protein
MTNEHTGMRAVRVVMAGSILLASAGIALAQNSPSPAEPRPGIAGSPFSRAPASPAPFASDPVNPYANPASPRRGIRTPYFGEENPYVTSTATPRRTKPAVGPGESAAQRQTGLNDADARSLVQQQGYTGINDLHPDPNSVWVWQADALKNGRRVRLGIDYRGNLLELGGAAQPCTSPGAGFGAGPLGTGARLSEANRCSTR